MKIIKESVQTQNVSIAIVIARFNELINKNLLFGAIDTLVRIGHVQEEKILKIYVPGTYEIPTVSSYIANSGNYDAIIAIGTIIQGDTYHFKNIANDTTSSLMKISTKYFIPITLGLLITENIQQSFERSGSKMGNKGSEAALAALEMINIMKKIKSIF